MANPSAPTWPSALGMQVETPWDAKAHDLGATAWNPANHGREVCPLSPEIPITSATINNPPSANVCGIQGVCENATLSLLPSPPLQNQNLNDKSNAGQSNNFSQSWTETNSPLDTTHAPSTLIVPGISACSKTAITKLPDVGLPSLTSKPNNSLANLTKDQMTWLLRRRLQKFGPLMVGMGRNSLSDMDEAAWIARGVEVGVTVPQGAAKKLALVFKPPYKTGHKISSTEPPPWSWIPGVESVLPSPLSIVSPIQSASDVTLKQLDTKIIPTPTPNTTLADNNTDPTIKQLREEVRELSVSNRQLKSSLQKRVGHLEYEISFLRKQNVLLTQEVQKTSKKYEEKVDLLERENSNLRLKMWGMTQKLEDRGETPKFPSRSIEW
eukprot:m.144032 g.144032  ORF g.144032 m.144032 type:complete len:382 (-) comp30349_c0_seq4:159-1304(-)